MAYLNEPKNLNGFEMILAGWYLDVWNWSMCDTVGHDAHTVIYPYAIHSHLLLLEPTAITDNCLGTFQIATPPITPQLYIKSSVAYGGGVWYCGGGEGGCVCWSLIWTLVWVVQLPVKNIEHTKVKQVSRTVLVPINWDSHNGLDYF